MLWWSRLSRLREFFLPLGASAMPCCRPAEMAVPLASLSACSSSLTRAVDHILTFKPRTSSCQATGQLWSPLSWCFFCCKSPSYMQKASQDRVCFANSTGWHTSKKVASLIYCLKAQCTDTGPNSPSTDPVTPRSRQGSHHSTNCAVTGMAGPAKAEGEPYDSHSRGVRLTARPSGRGTRFDLYRLGTAQRALSPLHHVAHRVALHDTYSLIPCAGQVASIKAGAQPLKGRMTGGFLLALQFLAAGLNQPIRNEVTGFQRSKCETPYASPRSPAQLYRLRSLVHPVCEALDARQVIYLPQRDAIASVLVCDAR